MKINHATHFPGVFSTFSTVFSTFVLRRKIRRKHLNKHSEKNSLLHIQDRRRLFHLWKIIYIVVLARHYAYSDNHITTHVTKHFPSYIFTSFMRQNVEAAAGKHYVRCMFCVLKGWDDMCDVWTLCALYV